MLTLLGLLDWQRTYNSHSGAIGALGPGWTTSFSANLVALAPQGLLHHAAGPVTFHDEDGRILTFTPSPDGRFTRPQDLEADLAKNADGTFALTFNSGEVWSVSATGQLTGRSREGQQVTLHYDSEGLLVRASHSFGRSLAFSYDANRRLTSVAADDGRTVAFDYTAGTVTDSLLETVTLPSGGLFRFQSSGSGQAGQVAQITEPDGNLIVANTYDPLTTRVTSQRFASSATVAFNYDDTSGVTTVTFSPSNAEATFEAEEWVSFVETWAARLDVCYGPVTDDADDTYGTALEMATQTRGIDPPTVPRCREVLRGRADPERAPVGARLVTGVDAADYR